LLEDPTTWGTNSKSEFGIREHPHQFSVNGLALLLKNLELAGDLYSPNQQRISTQICQMGKGIWAFWWQGLEQSLQCSWG
jgi:hypothetical protein